MKKIGYLVLCGILQACTNVEVVPEEPLSSEAQKYAHMGRLFEKDTTLFGGSDRENVRVNPYLWQATLDTLSFMGIRVADLSSGLIETQLYTPPGMTKERFKAVVTILGGRVRVNRVHLKLLSEMQKPSGTWVPTPSSRFLEQQLTDKIFARARVLKSHSLER